MSLTRDDVEKVALLARLELSADQAETLTAQLAEILQYVQQLSELDTDEVAPMAHAAELSNVFAADQVHDSLDREEMLANAGSRDEECYLVPAVLGD